MVVGPSLKPRLTGNALEARTVASVGQGDMSGGAGQVQPKALLAPAER